MRLRRAIAGARRRRGACPSGTLACHRQAPRHATARAARIAGARGGGNHPLFRGRASLTGRVGRQRPHRSAARLARARRGRTSDRGAGSLGVLSLGRVGRRKGAASPTLVGDPIRRRGPARSLCGFVVRDGSTWALARTDGVTHGLPTTNVVRPSDLPPSGANVREATAVVGLTAFDVTMTRSAHELTAEQSQPAAPAPDPAAAEEVRVAMALNGGVSLAVWMGGCATELDCARRAHLAPEPGRRAYHAMCRAFGRVLVIDLMSGSSAGGING